MGILTKISTFVTFVTDKYEWLLSHLLRIDKVQVRREKFTLKSIRRFHKEGVEELYRKAMDTSLSEVLTDEQKNEIYRGIIRQHALVVFIASFLTTFPESIVGMVVACVIDIVIFQITLYHAMQQEMMLFGASCDLKEDEDKGVETIITIESSGLMLGKYPIIHKLKSAIGWLLRQLVKRFGPRFASKAARGFLVIFRRQSIKWASLVLSKENIDMAFNALIPITCAIISGIVSVIILVPMCNKLRRHLIDRISADTRQEQG